MWWTYANFEALIGNPPYPSNTNHYSFLELPFFLPFNKFLELRAEIVLLLFVPSVQALLCRNIKVGERCIFLTWAWCSQLSVMATFHCCSTTSVYNSYPLLARSTVSCLLPSLFLWLWVPVCSRKTKYNEPFYLWCHWHVPGFPQVYNVCMQESLETMLSPSMHSFF